MRRIRRAFPTRLSRSARFYRRQVTAINICRKNRIYKSKKGAQDAHEAIRPTDANRTPESFEKLFERGRIETLSLDLAAFRRFADDAGDFRPDDD
jgi:DNA topoisomerase IA